MENKDGSDHILYACLERLVSILLHNLHDRHIKMLCNAALYNIKPSDSL